MHALGTRDLKRSLIDAFGRALLGVERVDDKDPRPPVRLEQLKNPDFRFELDPHGPIDGVELIEVRMQAPPPIDSQIRFSKPRGSRRDTCLRRSIAQTLESCPAPLSSVEVISVKLRFLVRYGSEPRSRSVTCELAMPRRCSLGDGPVDRVIGDALSRWGLYAEG